MKALLVLLLCLPVYAFTQQSTSAPVHKIIECVRAWDTPGCKSFQDMTDKGDEGVLIQLRPPQHAFVCFPYNRDTFVIASFGEPNASKFSPKPVAGHPSGIELAASVRINTYIDGVDSWSWSFIGTWMSSDRSFRDLAFVSNPSLFAQQQQDFAAIDDSEVQIQNTFQNMQGGMTTAVLTIRRSTLRFQEAFHGIIKSNGIEKELSTSDSGYCAEFK